MFSRTLVEDQAIRVTLEEAIRYRLMSRRWYRTHPFTVDWPTRYENDVILRALVSVARQARRTARPLVERLDPVTLGKEAEWAPGELTEAWGR